MSGETLVKICGLTRPQDALAAADAGADFLGLIFAAGSRRQVSVADAAAIAETVRRNHPVTPRLVGVFMDAEPTAIQTVQRLVGLDMIQLHGNEPPIVMDLVQAPVIRAFRVANEPPVTTGWENASWHLYDAASADGSGGHGRPFDWNLLREYERTQTPVLLAGGLNAGNVAAAIEMVRPEGVDVASGVEAAPGIKDHALMKQFIREAGRV